MHLAGPEEVVERIYIYDHLYISIMKGDHLRFLFFMLIFDNRIYIMLHIVAYMWYFVRKVKHWGGAFLSL